jgi:hypothetical protein
MEPSSKEEEYYARQEYERKRKLEAERMQSMQADEKQRLQELHYMKCPKCGMDLFEIDYKEIKIDKCTGCGGIWLDPGELEIVSAMEKSSVGKLFSLFK